MARCSAPLGQPSPRRSPRRSTSHQSLSPRRAPRPTTLHHFVVPRPRERELEVAFHVYQYHPPRRNIEITHAQSSALYYRTIPEQFNPFMGDGIWSFSPRSGIARTSTLGRKAGDIHFSLLPGTTDATFYVCVPHGQDKLQWVVAERGSQHPLCTTYVLYQRGTSAPRWVLAQTFAKYSRIHAGNLYVFNQ
ncbi:hypothetical protein FS749_005299 [Ceratobasidium sp. UAMH 11750]|nr:hypothetical protein FS749_005299 [Ceratobasidium sp. UAMH 11750]